MKAIRLVILLAAVVVGLPAMGAAQDATPAPSAPASQPPAAAKPAYETEAERLRVIQAELGRRGFTLPVRPRMVTPTLGLPFSADGTTTATQLLADGTRLQQQTNTRLFRDSAGRVRREQAIVGLTPAALPVVTITDPTAAVSYTLDNRTRIAYRAPLQVYVNNGGVVGTGPITGSARAVAVPGGGIRAEYRTQTGGRPRAEGPDDAVGVMPASTGSRTETLTTQQIGGLWSTGTRTSVRLASGMVGNDRPLDVTTERWISTDLNVVTLSRSNDPRVGTTEYRLFNVNRAEPPAVLFMVPTGYRVIDTVVRSADAVR